MQIGLPWILILHAVLSSVSITQCKYYQYSTWPPCVASGVECENLARLLAT